MVSNIVQVFLLSHKMGEAQSCISSTWICLYSILQFEVARQFPAKDNSLSQKKIFVNHSKYIFVQDLTGPMAGWFPDDLPATSAAKLGRPGQRLRRGIEVS